MILAIELRTEESIALVDDVIMSMDAAATKSPANLSSCRADIIFSSSAPSTRDFSMLDVQLDTAFSTTANAMAGLQALPAAVYAHFRSRSILESRTFQNVSTSSIRRVTCLAKYIKDASMTGAEIRGFPLGPFNLYSLASLLLRLVFLPGFCHSSCMSSSNSLIEWRASGIFLRLRKYFLFL